MPSDDEDNALAALQAGNGPVGGTRGVGVGLAEADGVAEALATGVGLVVSDGLGVGAASEGLEKRASERLAAVAKPAESLKKLLTN